MVKVNCVITKEHEVVKAFEYEVAETSRAVAESMEGVPFPMYGEYDGCMCEIVGVE